MSSSAHHIHIRLLAGLEISPEGDGRRRLGRADSEALAEAVANDLARIIPEAAEGMLSVAGALFEPGELLRPGWPAWQAMTEIADSLIQRQGLASRLMALGAHQGSLPHSALNPPETAPEGLFLAIPMVLSVAPDHAQELSSRLEASLFEQGGLHPPTLAAIAQGSGYSPVHGQLLTRADLLALQQVQLDSAGLAAFWPLVEHALLEPHESRDDFELPGRLGACWDVDSSSVRVTFTSFNQFDSSPDDYALWLRALRVLLAVLDSHGVAWRVDHDAPVVADKDEHILVENAGKTDQPDGLTLHQHAELGLVAWSLASNGQLGHYYPLTASAVRRLQSRWKEAGLEPVRHPDGLGRDPSTGHMAPAPGTIH